MYLIEAVIDNHKFTFCSKGKVAILKVVDFIKELLVDESIIDDPEEIILDNQILTNACVAHFEIDAAKGFNFTVWTKYNIKHFVMVEINKIEVLKL